MAFKMRCQVLGPRTPGFGTPEPGILGRKTQEPITQEPGSGTHDPEPLDPRFWT